MELVYVRSSLRSALDWNPSAHLYASVYKDGYAGVVIVGYCCRCRQSSAGHSNIDMTMTRTLAACESRGSTAGSRVHGLLPNSQITRIRRRMRMAGHPDRHRHGQALTAGADTFAKRNRYYRYYTWRDPYYENVVPLTRDETTSYWEVLRVLRIC